MLADFGHNKGKIAYHDGTRWDTDSLDSPITFCDICDIGDFARAFFQDLYKTVFFDEFYCNIDSW